MTIQESTAVDSNIDGMHTRSKIERMDTKIEALHAKMDLMATLLQQPTSAAAQRSLEHPEGYAQIPAIGQMTFGTYVKTIF